MENAVQKQGDYYSVVRSEIVPLLPVRMERVLDVGCGRGATGAFLKREKGARNVCGIELMPEAAAIARGALDQVLSLNLNTPEPLPFPPRHFDLILCLDVLEHLVDPWAALGRITEHLAPGGTLIVSVPNLRHFKTSLPLLLQGKFEYEESGVRDSTHLRFFTRRSALSLVTGAGLVPAGILHTGRPPWSKTWLLNALTLGLFRELFDFQYVIAARKES